MQGVEGIDLVARLCEITEKVRGAKSELAEKLSKLKSDQKLYRGILVQEMSKKKMDCVKTPHFNADQEQLYLKRSTCTSNRNVSKEVLETAFNLLIQDVSAGLYEGEGKESYIDRIVNAFLAHVTRLTKVPSEYVLFTEKPPRGALADYDMLSSSAREIVNELVTIDIQIYNLGKPREGLKALDMERQTIERELLKQMEAAKKSSAGVNTHVVRRMNSKKMPPATLAFTRPRIGECLRNYIQNSSVIKLADRDKVVALIQSSINLARQEKTTMSAKLQVTRRKE